MSSFSQATPAPSNANEQCVGPNSELAGKASSCAGCPNQGACASGAAAAPDPSAAHVLNRMAQVKHKILILSGKGGVGKSTVSSQLSFALSLDSTKEVGLLDIDICGPSIPRMLGLMGQEVHQSASGWSPVYVEDNLGVMSIGFMLPSSDDAIIWRGPRKTGLIKQFLTDVVWNDLDYLLVDTPPGTSDEHISIVQLLKDSHIDGAVVVTTPQEVSMADVRKELNFCKKTGITVLGVVENMADTTVPLASALDSDKTGVRFINASGEDVTAASVAALQKHCPELLECSLTTNLFRPSTDAAAESNPATMARRFGVPYLGHLPMDPNMMSCCERGENFLQKFPTSAAAAPLRSIVANLLRELEKNKRQTTSEA
jgi:Mrp family chromosome partitioning ATPase